MDVHTLTAAQGTSTAAHTPKETPAYSREILGKIRAKLGGISIERIEQQFRGPIQATARAAIELGMRLIFLKEMTPHGDWLPKLRLLGTNETVAASMMACVVRILSLPEADRLIDAAGSKSKLFELLALDDEELSRLNQGEAVRGVSLTTLPQTSVRVLRSMLKGKSPAPMPPTAEPLMGNSESAAHLPFGGLDPAAPIIGQAEEHQASALDMTTQASDFKSGIDSTFENRASALDTTTPLQTGDRVHSLHAGRPGQVVKVYPDGSACVCWDDGEPQAEGLGHERMPRHLLALQPAEDPADYPAVYALLPGDFNGQPVSIIGYEGRSWLIDHEVAALVGTTPAEVAEVERILADWQYQELPDDAWRKLRLASTPQVLSVMDRMALEMLAIRWPGEASAALAAWFCADSKPAEVIPLKKPKALKAPAEYLKQLREQHYQAYRMLSKVHTQIKGLHELATLVDERRLIIDLGELAAVALDIVADYDELTEDIDLTTDDLAQSLEAETEPAH